MRIRLLGQYLHSQVIALALVEAGLFGACLYLAYFVRFTGLVDAKAPTPLEILPTAAVFTVAVSGGFFSLGLYTTRQRARVRGLGIRIVVAVLGAVGASAIAFYMYPGLLLGRGVMAIAACFAVVAAVLARSVSGRLIDTEVLKKRVIIFGNCSRLGIFDKLRRRSDRRGYTLVGIVSADAEPPETLASYRLLQAPEGLYALCREQGIDEIVVVLEDRRGALPQRELLKCRIAGINVIDLVSFLERETGRIHLEVLTPSWMIFNEGFRRDGLRQFSSRTLDFFASTLLLIVTSPLMIATALAITIESRGRGGVFYRQDRVGYQGRVFKLIKFRSMRVDAEVAGKPQWAQMNDSRVTRVGSFIRKTRIDELPQLWNILTGKMSFVGPRPERPFFVEELERKIPYYSYRHSVKPGLTGWAQLCYPYGASEQDAEAKLQYDLYYVKNNSLLFDLGILVQTAEVVFLGKGAR